MYSYMHKFQLNYVHKWQNLSLKTQTNMKNYMIKRGPKQLNHAICDFMMYIMFTMNNTIVYQLEWSKSKFIRFCNDKIVMKSLILSPQHSKKEKKKPTWKCEVWLKAFNLKIPTGSSLSNV